MGRFLDGESTECTKLDNPRQFSVDLFQSIERAIQREDGISLAAATSLASSIATQTHRRPVCLRSDDGRDRRGSGASLRRDAEEMCSVLPVALPLVDKPHVRLVNQGRGLQRVVGPLVAKLSRRDTAELRIDERQQ